jgi:hypothetical protein
MMTFLRNVSARNLLPALTLATLTAGMASLSACKKNEPAPVAPAEVKTEATTQGSASCLSDPRVVPYQPNLKVAGNSHNLTFVVTEATPTPPAGGKNAWTVQVLSASGAPASSYTLTATPYMPDHAHGPATAPTVQVQGDKYLISNIDFFMGGVWRTTLTAKDAQGNIVDAANVFLCIAG